ncbi:hypothetical protein PR048_018931 [Dryococelus australis]|uniref:Uncharacterized protein n=1 Tax=Dryococelus australis TaxID=614101 RepID=A0ABQ9H215_9NEOP|nr:hypothetical protein PR048_018931 [Dryococelus australis]
MKLRLQIRHIDFFFCGATLAERLAYSPPNKAIRIQSPAGSLRMPLVGGFFRGTPVSPALSFRRCFILTSITLIGSQDLNVNIHLTTAPPRPRHPVAAACFCAETRRRARARVCVCVHAGLCLVWDSVALVRTIVGTQARTSLRSISRGMALCQLHVTPSKDGPEVKGFSCCDSSIRGIALENLSILACHRNFPKYGRDPPRVRYIYISRPGLVWGTFPPAVVETIVAMAQRLVALSLVARPGSAHSTVCCADNFGTSSPFTSPPEHSIPLADGRSPPSPFQTPSKSLLCRELHIDGKAEDSVRRVLSDEMAVNISTAHWLSAATVEGDNWASVLREVSNTVLTNDKTSAVCLTSERNERLVVSTPQSESVREREAVLSPGCAKECSLSRVFFKLRRGLVALLLVDVSATNLFSQPRVGRSLLSPVFPADRLLATRKLTHQTTTMCLGQGGVTRWHRADSRWIRVGQHSAHETRLTLLVSSQRSPGLRLPSVKVVRAARFPPVEISGFEPGSPGCEMNSLTTTPLQTRCFSASGLTRKTYQLGSPLVDDWPIMNAVKYRVVSGVVWANRTMGRGGSGAAPYSTRFTLILSQVSRDLDVKSSPKLYNFHSTPNHERGTERPQY